MTKKFSLGLVVMFLVIAVIAAVPLLNACKNVKTSLQASEISTRDVHGDDNTKVVNMGLLHAIYGTWSDTSSTGDTGDSSTNNHYGYGFINTTLTARAGNQANSLSFSLTKGAQGTDVLNPTFNKVENSNRYFDGYRVGNGLALLYMDNNLMWNTNFEYIVSNSPQTYNFSTGNLSLQWNKQYSVKLLVYFNIGWTFGFNPTAFMFVEGHRETANATLTFNDTNAPVGVLNGVVNNGIANNDVSFSWADGRATATLDGGNYSKGSLISSEGGHSIKLTDQAGNYTNYSFTIDKIKPQNNLNYTWYGSQIAGYKAYTSEPIIFAPSDNGTGLASVGVKLNNGSWVTNQEAANVTGYNVNFSGNKITVPNSDNNGSWFFRATDVAGNVSDEQCVVMELTPSFGNQEIIKNSFKTNSWYNVVLPANIFGIEGRDISGTYSVEEYDNALKFATSKEWEYRVSVVPAGWMYVNAGNGNLAQIYTDRAELDSVVEKYAKTYIRERSIARNGTNNFTNILNDKLEIDTTGLTRQHLTKPGFLSLNLPVYFMRPDFKFVDPGFMADTFVKIQMLATDLELVSRSEIQLQYDVRVSDQIFINDNNGQGYYLVTEWSTTGQEEQYYVYIDLSAPGLSGTALFGDGRNETITFDEALIYNYDGSFRYLSLDLNGIFDSVDNYSVITINGRRMTDETYTQGDTLPVLDGIDYYGNYTFELYDRSGNTLSFTVAISAGAPYMSTSSLQSDISCRLTLNLPDNVNAITSIKLYHILYDGTYEELSNDHMGVAVAAGTLQYTITIGGKYTLWYQDLFGRTVECAPVFYVKGLPTATLTGVVDGGITNRNVSLRFSDEYILILYKLENGVRSEVVVDGFIFSCVLDEINHRYTATIIANEETTASYVFFLYNKADIGLFVEYTFAIDCIIAPVVIINNAGAEISKNTYTNRSFSIMWNENASIRYYMSNTPGGELGAIRYSMGTVLTANGTYFFTLQDSVGNEEQFTILLDSVVSYRIEGDFVLTNENEYAARSDLKFSITEINAVTSFTSTPSVVNGGMITAEGLYTISITDAYGNSVVIIIVIDKTAPVISLQGVENGGATNSIVMILSDEAEHLYLVNANEQILREIENETIFNDEGYYRVMAVDEIGNSIVVSFTIIKNIAYTSSIVDTGITTNAVSFAFTNAVLEQVTTLDGIKIESLTKYTTPGKYVITAQDVLGNELMFSFIILAAKVKVIDLDNMLGFEILASTRNNVDYIITITEEGKIKITDSGKYAITLKNTNKNVEFAFTVEIDNKVDYVANIPNNTITTDYVSLSFGESVKQTILINGVEGKSASRYTKAGDYKVTITDGTNNELVFTFVILPQRMQMLDIPFTGLETVLVTKNGKNMQVDINDERLRITGSGQYVLFLKVTESNTLFSFSVEVDDVPPTCGINKDNGSFTTTNVSKENVVMTLTRNGEELSYTHGRRIEGAGEYILTLTDDLGNTNVYEFTLDEPLNWASFAAIAGLIILGGIILLFVVVSKRRLKVR